MQSFEESFKLFKQGLSWDEIARKRNVALSTLEEHAALMISKKLIRVEEVLGSERIELILKGIEGKGFNKFGELKRALPLDVSYTEIKWVLASLGKYPVKPFVAPIARVIKVYRASNCFRKCFAHRITMNDCAEKFTKLAIGFGNSEIEAREFFRLMNSGELEICLLPMEKRKEIIYWKEFEKMADKGKDLWDTIPC